MKYECLFGLEVEGVYSRLLREHIKLGGYHKASFNSSNNWSKYFVCEGDSSIRTEERYPNAVEIVSTPFLYNERFDVLSAFEDTAITRSGKDLELDNFFKFNGSCGCHINVSITKESEGDMIVINSDRQNLTIKDRYILPLNKWVNFKTLTNIREKVLDQIEDKYGKEVRDKWFRNYNRPTFAPLCKSNLEYNKKYSELHIRKNNARLEFRGFHLQGITTWEEFKWYLTMFMEVIQYELTTELNKKIKFEDKEDLSYKFNVSYKKMIKTKKEL